MKAKLMAEIGPRVGWLAPSMHFRFRSARPRPRQVADDVLADSGAAVFSRRSKDVRLTFCLSEQ